MTEAVLFRNSQVDEAASYYNENGFVAFADLLSPTDLEILRAAIDSAQADGRLRIGEQELASNNDVVLLDPLIKDVCCDPGIVAIARRLTGHPIELQHAKFNAKPVEDVGGGRVAWHQDFPFYPHTNYDMVSCVIHLDDEDSDAGPLKFIPGSHKKGPLSHVRTDGSFAYECTGCADLDRQFGIELTGPAGFVSFHHCLALHSSAPKRRSGHRRLIVFQYRATDAVPLAGVIWRCNGMQVEEQPPVPRVARFPDGTTIDLRGIGGRLYDVGGLLAPDRPAP